MRKALVFWVLVLAVVALVSEAFGFAGKITIRDDRHIVRFTADEHDDALLNGVFIAVQPCQLFFHKARRAEVVSGGWRSELDGFTVEGNFDRRKRRVVIDNPPHGELGYWFLKFGDGSMVRLIPADFRIKMRTEGVVDVRNDGLVVVGVEGVEPEPEPRGPEIIFEPGSATILFHSKRVHSVTTDREISRDPSEVDSCGWNSHEVGWGNGVRAVPELDRFGNVFCRIEDMPKGKEVRGNFNILLLTGLKAWFMVNRFAVRGEGGAEVRKDLDTFQFVYSVPDP